MTEALCMVPNCNKVAIYPTQVPPGEKKLACLQHWEEFEQWKIDRGI